MLHKLQSFRQHMLPDRRCRLSFVVLRPDRKASKPPRAKAQTAQTVAGRVFASIAPMHQRDECRQDACRW